jgi:hypothetical protein
MSCAVLHCLSQALRVSVGKLGILARVQFRIVREVPVRRVLKAMTPTELQALMQKASADYAATGSIPHWMNETQIFWVVQKNQVSSCWFVVTHSQRLCQVDIDLDCRLV